MHILCVWPSLDHIRKDQLYSINSASARLPVGPQRQLVATLLDMALHWSPWHVHQTSTGSSPPHIQRLPITRSRALLTDTCRSFARATRSIWEGFCTLVKKAEHMEDGTAVDYPYLSPPTFDTRGSVLRHADGLPFSGTATLEHAQIREFDPLSRLREEGDYG